MAIYETNLRWTVDLEDNMTDKLISLQSSVVDAWDVISKAFKIGSDATSKTQDNLAASLEKSQAAQAKSMGTTGPGGSVAGSTVTGATTGAAVGGPKGAIVGGIVGALGGIMKGIVKTITLPFRTIGSILTKTLGPFLALGQLIDKIVGPALMMVTDIIEQLIQPFQIVLLELFSQLYDYIPGVSRLLAPLLDFFKDFGKFLQPLTLLLEPFRNVMKALTGLLPTLLRFIEPLVKLFRVWMTLFAGLLKLSAPVVRFVGTLLNKLADLIEMIPQAMDAILEKLGMMPVFGPLFGGGQGVDISDLEERYVTGAPIRDPEVMFRETGFRQMQVGRREEIGSYVERILEGMEKKKMLGGMLESGKLEDFLGKAIGSQGWGEPKEGWQPLMDSLKAGGLSGETRGMLSKWTQDIVDTKSVLGKFSERGLMGKEVEIPKPSERAEFELPGWVDTIITKVEWLWGQMKSIWDGIRGVLQWIGENVLLITDYIGLKGVRKTVDVTKGMAELVPRVVMDLGEDKPGGFGQSIIEGSLEGEGPKDLQILAQGLAFLYKEASRWGGEEKVEGSEKATKDMVETLNQIRDNTRAAVDATKENKPPTAEEQAAINGDTMSRARYEHSRGGW